MKNLSPGDGARVRWAPRALQSGPVPAPKPKARSSWSGVCRSPSWFPLLFRGGGRVVMRISTPSPPGTGLTQAGASRGLPRKGPLPAAPPAHQRVRCGRTLEPSGPSAPDSAPDSAQSSPLPGTPSWAWGEGWERTVWSRGPGARTLPKLPAGHRGSARAGCLLGQAACPPGPSTLVPGSCPIRELS